MTSPISPGNFKPTKKIPSAFKRPSISIGGDTKKREWRYVTAMEVREGDIVADLGLVHNIEYIYQNDPVQVFVRILAGDMQTPIKFESSTLFKAFA